MEPFIVDESGLEVTVEERNVFRTIVASASLETLRKFGHDQFLSVTAKLWENLNSVEKKEVLGHLTEIDIIDLLQTLEGQLPSQAEQQMLAVLEVIEPLYLDIYPDSGHERWQEILAAGFWDEIAQSSEPAS